MESVVTDKLEAATIARSVRRLEFAFFSNHSLDDPAHPLRRHVDAEPDVFGVRPCPLGPLDPFQDLHLVFVEGNTEIRVQPLVHVDAIGARNYRHEASDRCRHNSRRE